MTDKKGFFSEIKNQIITTIGVIITAAGGLVVTNMEVLFGIDKDPQQIESAAVTAESKIDTLVIVQKEQPKVIVKKVEVKPKKTKTEERKDNFDW